ncbi:prephenate dehydrogenase [uncultured Micrococcus sp.]|uniref:prephenate dehydrogenase n=1 Tax=uncultured Micrococcus sp. TaxID=114051 RepID=UPI0025DC2ADA|nr:prephenate dehydrogenase [uncultured Micrococcus sp.]
MTGPGAGVGAAGVPQPVLVRGTGLLGTSIGLGLRAAGAEVLLTDPSPSAQAVAEDIGAGRAVDPEDPSLAPGLVVVAAPPDVTADVVVDSLRRWPVALVLDIASIKGRILTQVRDAAARGVIEDDDVARYLPTHPMAGSERSGPVAARGTLFTASPWVLCPSPETRPEALAAGEDVARALQATVHRMDVAAHDASVALISHLPQIAASLVASRLQDAPDASLALAGNGLRDTTRIAGSDPQLWVQILAGNAEHIVPALHGLRADVERLIATLEAPTAPGARLDVAQLMAEGNAGRARIPGKHGAPPQAFALVTVIVDDTPGQLAALFEQIGRAGVNVEDMRLDHASGYRVGMVDVSVLPGRRDELVSALTDAGWKVV